MIDPSAISVSPVSLHHTCVFYQLIAHRCLSSSLFRFYGPDRAKYLVSQAIGHMQPSYQYLSAMAESTHIGA